MKTFSHPSAQPSPLRRRHRRFHNDVLSWHEAKGRAGQHRRDTRVIAGNEYITAPKLSKYEFNKGACFLMTSGLRSVRDKTITYFERLIANRQEPFTYTYDAPVTLDFIGPPRPFPRWPRPWWGASADLRAI